jgi:hypothetical protein
VGASFSAVAALQVMIRHPGVFSDFVMGSPSVVFDPEVLDDLVEVNNIHIVKGEEGEREGEEEEGEVVGALVLIGEKEHAVRALYKSNAVGPIAKSACFQPFNHIKRWFQKPFAFSRAACSATPRVYAWRATCTAACRRGRATSCTPCAGWGWTP